MGTTQIHLGPVLDATNIGPMTFVDVSKECEGIRREKMRTKEEIQHSINQKPNVISLPGFFADLLVECIL